MRVLMSCGCKLVVDSVDGLRCSRHPEGFPYRRDHVVGVEVWNGQEWGGVITDIWDPLPEFHWGRFQMDSKFWSILACLWSPGSSTYVVHFGKIGTAGQFRWKNFDFAWNMAIAVDKIVKQKRAKGYVDAPPPPVLNPAWEAAKDAPEYEDFKPLNVEAKRSGLLLPHSNPPKRKPKKKSVKPTQKRPAYLDPVAFGSLDGLEFED